MWFRVMKRMWLKILQVEKALADYKQSSEMKYPEQEARINDLENNYKRLRQMVNDIFIVKINYV